VATSDVLLLVSAGSPALAPTARSSGCAAWFRELGYMRSGPVLIAFDSSPAALRALQEAAELLAPRPGLVVVVWEAGAAYDFADIPSSGLDLPPVQLDLRAAAELDQARYTEARELARHGAAIARSLGMPAEGLAVADELTVSETLVRVAGDLDAVAVVVGRHDHSALRDVLLGSTAKGLLRHAPCPVLVVRHVEKSATSARSRSQKSGRADRPQFH
jgi:nucleotide-binding universal stress UspA family protein